MPRDTPVWVYRLSSHTPADDKTHRIAHLQDGSLQLSDWLDDARQREFMARRGSLLRPVLESISERKAREDVTQVKVVVLTDGELLDVSEITIPVGMDIVGLTSSVNDGKCQQWRRVLPNIPLFDLLDHRVDQAFVDVSQPFYGACEVSWCQGDIAVRAHVVDLTSARIVPLDGMALPWNFLDRPLLLLLETDGASAVRPTIVCRSVKNNQLMEVLLTDDVVPLDTRLIGQVAALRETGAARNANVVLDVKASDPDFATVREHFLAATILTESRAAWIKADGTAMVWQGNASVKAVLCEDGTFQFDALLCLANLELVNRQQARIVIIGLDKRIQPALQVGPGSLLDLGELSVACTIRFDIREARWILSQGSHTRELDPRYGEKLTLPVTKGESSLVVLFSGPLR